MAEQDNTVSETRTTENATPSGGQSARSGGSRPARGGGGRRAQGSRPYRRRPYGRRRRKVCQFCVDKVKAIDYKDVPLLRQYLSRSARIRSRRKTGTCAKHQRMLAKAIKRARHIAFLPYTAEHVRHLGA